MQLQPLQSIVDSMLSQYKAYGIAEVSYDTYKNGFCKPIVRFCDERNGGMYSADVLDSYLSMQKEKLANNEIGSTYYSTTARIVRLLKSVAETGTADFSKKKPDKRYIPSQQHQEMVDRIIELNNVSAGAAKKLHVHIRHLFCYIEEKDIADKELTDSVFFDFLASVTESQKGCTTEIMRALKFTTAYLKANGSENLCTDFSLLPVKKPATRMIPPYSHEEIKRIVDAIDITQPMGKRDYAIILLAFDTGLRGIDIIRLKNRDIDWRRGTLSIRQSKTKHPITQALKGVVLNALADYILEVRPDNGEEEIFLSIRPPYKALCGCDALDYIIEKYCRLANVEKKPRRAFHSVRRAFATELSLKGIPLGEISELLGHRSLRSDKPYLSYDRENIAFVAGDFSGIPITGGIYARMMRAEGGTCNGVL